MEVRDAVQQFIRNQHKDNGQWEKRHRGRLAVSDLGHCPRKALLRVAGVKQTNPFDDYVLEIMRAGTVWEDETERALRLVYGDRLSTQDRVSNDDWVGHTDFMVIPGQLWEHKATNSVNFRRKNGLPYEFHCLQLLGYQRLIKETTGEEPEAFLYYRSWADWAELQVWGYSDEIYWEGEMNGYTKSGSFDLSIDDEMAKLEKYLHAYRETKELPDKYDMPFEKQFACCRVNKKKGTARPSCTYFSHCWPEYDGNEAILI